jgi:acyl-CoA synthetase (AMP-forming)/AMP-acid ligase II
MDTISQYLYVHARRHPERTAVVFNDIRISYGELDRRVNRFANALLDHGLHKGDLLAVLATNSHHYLELHLACARAGLVIVPINVMLSLGEIRYVINDARPKAIVVDQSFSPILVEVLRTTDCIKVSVEIGRKTAAMLSYDELLAKGRDTEPDVAVYADDLRAIQYTSGTTAEPKGCLSTHRQQMTSACFFVIEIPFPRDAPSLLIAPAFTGVGAYMCTASVLVGATLVVLPRFDVGAVLEAIERERIAHLFGVPTMITALANEQEKHPRDLSSLRLIGYGGAKISPTQTEKVMSVLNCDFYQFFGATETGGAVTFLTPEDHRTGNDTIKKTRLQSCGRPALLARVKILDDHGNEAGAGEIGEFLVRSPSCVAGYLNKPEETSQLFKGDWLNTGEIARMDSDGYIYIVDRAKDMIRTGGMSVAPAEVEAVLHQHPAVEQVAVIGVPDEHYTEAVKAIVKRRLGNSATAEELIAFVRARLAGYKTPKSVDFAIDLPTNASGKILKREIRAAYWSKPDV